MVLNPVGKTDQGRVDRHGRQHLEHGVNEEPAAATGVEGVEEVEMVGLLEGEEVGDEFAAGGGGGGAAEEVDVGGVGVGEGFAAGVAVQVGSRGGFLEEGGFGGFGSGSGGVGHGRGDEGVGVGDVGEAVAVVEGEEQGGEGQVGGVGSEGLARGAGDDPFLPGAVLGAVEVDGAVDEVVVEAVEVGAEARDHVVRQPGGVGHGGGPV